MSLVKIIVGLIIVGLGAFGFLGFKSQKGAAMGIVDGQLAPCSSKPNCVSSEVGAPDDKKIAPLATDMGSAKAAILSQGGEIITESDIYVAAIFKSKIFRFVDDVELRDSGDGFVQIRSASRVGYSDRGVNRKRVEAIRAAL